MASSVWTSVSPQKKAWRKPLSGQQRRSQSVKKWFRPSINRFDFISRAWEFSLSYGKVVIYNERCAKYRFEHPDCIPNHLFWRMTSQEQYLTWVIEKLWQHNSFVFVACLLPSFELWVLKWNWNWKKGSRFNCYRVHCVWKVAEITIQTSFVKLELTYFSQMI